MDGREKLLREDYIADILSPKHRISMRLPPGTAFNNYKIHTMRDEGQNALGYITRFQSGLDRLFTPTEIGVSNIIHDGLAGCSYLVGMLYTGKESTNISYDLFFDLLERPGGYKIVKGCRAPIIAQIYIQSKDFHGNFIISQNRVKT